jgi:hypothetical protein
MTWAIIKNRINPPNNLASAKYHAPSGTSNKILPGRNNWIVRAKFSKKSTKLLAGKAKKILINPIMKTTIPKKPINRQCSKF